jgi:hypothetical protein
MLNNEMNRLFAEGGVMQEGGTVDPVSGNEVPPGAMQEEVRDDIDAKLSEGEFVFPADVVRYIGLDTLMKLRDKAKTGLQRMEEIGQMGNAEEVPNAEALHGEDSEMDDESFASEVDSILEEEETEKEFARGGYVAPTSAQISGTDATQTSQYQAGANQQIYKDAPVRGFEMVPMVNDGGQVIYIPFINGVPQLSVPAGYRVRPVTETPTTPTTPEPQPTTTGTGTSAATGGGDTQVSGEKAPGNVGFTIGSEGFAKADTVSPKTAGLVGSVLGLVTGIPGLGFVAKEVVERGNTANEKAAAAFNVAVRDTTDVSNIDTSLAAATTGVEGTGGKASQAGADAAAAAAAAGKSDAAIGAAAQAAANAVIGGATLSDALSAGRAAADAVDVTESKTTDVTVGGPIDAPGAQPTDLSPISDDQGVTVGGPIDAPGAQPTDLGPAPDSGPDSGGGGGLSSQGASADTGTDGIGFAEGGFVKKNPTGVTKKTGLASRRK